MEFSLLWFLGSQPAGDLAINQVVGCRYIPPITTIHMLKTKYEALYLFDCNAYNCNVWWHIGRSKLKTQRLALHTNTLLLQVNTSHINFNNITNTYITAMHFLHYRWKLDQIHYLVWRLITQGHLHKHYCSQCITSYYGNNLHFATFSSYHHTQTSAPNVQSTLPITLGMKKTQRWDYNRTVQ